VLVFLRHGKTTSEDWRHATIIEPLFLEDDPLFPKERRKEAHDVVRVEKPIAIWFKWVVYTPTVGAGSMNIKKWKFVFPKTLGI
jgi:hypothetical protein